MLSLLIIILQIILHLSLQDNHRNDNTPREKITHVLTRSMGVTLREQLGDNPDIQGLYAFKNEIINKLFSKAKKKGHDYHDENSFSSTSYPSTNNLFSVNYSLLAKSLITKTKAQKAAAHTLKGPEEILDNEYEDNLKKLPLVGNSKVMPWSGYYWAFRYGIGSLRYCYNEKNTMYQVKDGKRGSYYTYKQSIEKYRQPAVAKYQISESNKKKYPANTMTDFEKYVHDFFSATEKYDLLVGDLNYTLTNYMKAQGKKYMDSNGDVAAWIGYCHGWSPASFLEKRPVKAVTLKAADGKTNIDFNPDDIEYMATTFWANADYDTRICGTRCSEINYCLSIDPGVFFIIIANQIGIREKNLIFEPKVDAEIWNYPVYGYLARLWNIISQYYKKKLEDALVTRSELVKAVGNKKATGNNTYDFTSSDFLPNVLNQASASTEYFLGVELTIKYVTEDFPFHGDEVWEDSVESKDYTCVLFLDKNYIIIGGVWAQEIIPTFVWLPDENTPSHGPYDSKTATFTGTVDELKKYTKSAVLQSGQGMVLKSIMKYLAEKSSAQ